MQGKELEKRVHTAVDMVTEVLIKEVEPFDPKWHFSSMFFSILCALCFGTSYEFDDPIMQKAMKTLDDLTSLSGSFFLLEDFIPPLRKCPVGKYKTFLRLVNDLIHDFLGKEFYRHVESHDPENLRDFTDFLIQARKAAEDEDDESVLDSLTDDHLIQSLSDIFFAGVDTTRATLRWVFLYLAACPDLQEKIQKEVDGIVGRDRLPRLYDRPNLPYTEAFLYEVMRLSTAAPIGVPRQAVCDTKIGEYDVPKGTMVIINYWALNHDPKNWEDVDQFKPDRYLTNDGELGPKPDHWLPFSAGPRVCLGESVARPELHLLLASLMQRFTVRFPEGAQADFTPLNGIGVNYPKDQKLVIKPRN
ncbi:hypothetical protein CHS0354_037705 [Potamilus streckersoni]|uniref:Cytochrome P450 n=1 Tax=Potamilus streckersoni TaxID=2493646 RepID=A0AAE0T0E2_9BIVA|nr:hypothetical protein CHS0354_037705 [Potamilus streckersoni]